MRITKQRQATVTDTVVTCDFCGKRSGMVCIFCGRDVCIDCRIDDPEDNSDYPGCYCIPCWDIGDPFRAEIERLRGKIKEAEEQWKQAAKAAAKHLQPPRSERW